MLASDYNDTIEVWPDAWPAVQLFCQVKTQWRMGFMGPTGLDYDVLFDLMDRKQFSGDDWWQMFNDIRHLESEALDVLRSEKS